MKHTLQFLSALALASLCMPSAQAENTGKGEKEQPAAVSREADEGRSAQARALMSQQRYQDAMRVSQTIEDTTIRRDIMLRSIDAVVADNRYGHATELVRYFGEIHDTYGKAMAYLAIAEGQARDGMELAKETFGKARKAAAKIEDPTLKERAEAAIAQAKTAIDYRQGR